MQPIDRGEVDELCVVLASAALLNLGMIHSL